METENTFQKNNNCTRFMARVKRGNVARKRRQKTLKLSSGFKGSSSTLFRISNQHVLKAFQQSFQDRAHIKRVFRQTWITRINAATRNNGLNYSQFVRYTKRSGVALNRKIVSQLSVLDKQAFHQLVEFVQ